MIITLIYMAHHVAEIILRTCNDTAFELPQVNYKYYNGKKYQFMYGLAISTLVDPADVSSTHTQHTC